MCGISGKLHFDCTTPVSESLIRGMTKAIAHRGPDDEGIHVKGPVGLGHRRLSIIDLSPAGHQPMSNRAGNIWITFNGEIYNFQSLRKELERDGVSFRSHSDTEVILALYEKFGIDCIAHLRGMFAFAIWDERLNRLFLVRDRLGKKPLKYAITSNGITFASELKAILKDPDVPRDIDETAIHHFLSLQHVPSPRTGFRGIQKLPPAHYLMWEKGKTTLKQYWTLDFSQKLSHTEDEWIELVRNEIKTAVQLRMISDVPLGVFLSGGIDSSIITTLMAQASSKPIKTFSIIFDEKKHDESPYIQKIVQQLGTEHQQWIIKPDARKELEQLVEQYEEPYADPAALPTYCMSREVKKEVTVVLNGDGGDENFAGYRAYAAYVWDKKFFHQWPQWIRKSAARLTPKSFDRMDRFFAHPDRSPEERWLQYVCFFTEDERSELYTPERREQFQNESTSKHLANYFNASHSNDALDRVLFTDTSTHLPDNLLTKVDMATMAFGVESRSPFLDHRFMELAASMPSHLKLRGTQGKFILKKAFSKEIPHDILHRPKKGFDLPLDEWFRTELNSYAHDVLLSPKAMQRGWFQKEKLEKLFKQHTQGERDYGRQLWTLLMLELWFQHYVD